MESTAQTTMTGPPGEPKPITVDPVAEKRVVRKMDRNIVTLIFALYLLSFLDRSNVGNAETAGMQKDLKLSSGDYQWLLTIFYIAYIVFEWLTLLWKALPPHVWAAFAIFGWGVVSTCQAATTSWSGMMACRFLLGAFEAGFGPGVPYYLSFFYLRHEVGTRIGLFLSAAPLASCFAGALAYGITHGHTSIASWRVLFLVEGLPTVVMAGVAYWFLPDVPAKARFLTEDEKAITRARGVTQVGEELDYRIGHIVWSDIVKATFDPKNLLTALMYFSTNIGFSSLPVYLPTILTDFGFSPINAQGLSAPPYFLAFIAVIATTYIADRTQQRGIVIATVSLIGAIGYIVLATTKSVGARYTGVFLAAFGVFPAIINVLPWCLNNQGSDTKRGTGIVVLNLIGQCSPLLGTRLYPADEKPYYRKGQWVCCAFLLFNVVLALTLRQYLVWENKKLDQKYGPRKRIGEMGVAEGVTPGSSTEKLVGNENDGPNFRYVL